MSEFQEAVKTSDVRMLKIFKSRIPNISYVFRDGEKACFIPRTSENAGHYLTDDEVHIKELQEVVAARGGHMHLYIDPNEYEVRADLADPAVAYRNRIREEERAKLIAELGDPNQQRAAGLDQLLLNRAAKVADSESGPKSLLGGISSSASILQAAQDSNALGAVKK